MKNISKIVVCALVLSGAASCNKWLDVTPDNAINDKDLFATGYGFRNALNGIYLAMSDPYIYGQEMTWGFMGALGQEYNQREFGKYGRYEYAADLNFETREVEDMLNVIWERTYRVIANINKMLHYLDDADQRIFAYEEDEMTMIRGEAHALRAMLHLDMLRLFAPAPATNPAGTYIPYRDEYGPQVAVKLSVPDFMEKVNGDLEIAYDCLKEVDLGEFNRDGMHAWQTLSASTHSHAMQRFRGSPSGEGKERFFWYRGTRMNYFGVLGLMARSYMYAGDHANAKKYASELYDGFYLGQEEKWLGFNEPSTITTSLGGRFTKLSDDLLFAVYRKELAREFKEVQTYMTGDAVSLVLSNIESLYSSDGGGTYDDYRKSYTLAQTNDSQANYYSLKYYHSALLAEDSSENKIEASLIPMIRFSEVCHILAEIACRENRIADGVGYLSEVRRARGAFRSLGGITTQEQLMEEIIKDARKEYMSEGQTFFLYKRLNLTAVDSGNFPGTAINMAYVLPVPQSESVL